MNNTAQLEDLIRRGHYAQARTRAQEMLLTSSDLRTKQIYAFALSRSGVPEAAREFLESVARENPDDAETNGILGGIYKELFKKNQSSTFAILARDTYDKNFKQTRSYYTGINAATMSMMAGQARRGKELAQEVLTVLADTEQDFWQTATQAEAYLLLKERGKSEESYRKARKLAASDWGKISSVYNQLWLLKHYLPVPPEALRAFSPPVVVAFVGHMLDDPQRPQPRFPASIEPQVKAALFNAITAINGKIGYCSLACGGDILFAEAMEEAGGELNLFLPFKQDDFIESSVRFAGDDWVDRFYRLVNKYPVTYLTQESYEDHPDLFSLQTSIIFGLSMVRSNGHHQEPNLMTVLSERDQRRKQGGTRDTVSLWPNPKTHISINPDIFVPGLPVKADVAGPDGKPSRSDRPVLYFVCCDLSTESKLNISLRSAMEASSLPPIIADANDTTHLIAGFKTIFSAMEFCELVNKTTVRPFQQKNIVRISLHVGPYPVQGSNIYQTLSGRLIENLLRLHKLTAPGSIYATAIFVAVLALNKDKYAFDYIDTLQSGDSTRPLDIYRVNVSASANT